MSFNPSEAHECVPRTLYEDKGLYQLGKLHCEKVSQSILKHLPRRPIQSIALYILSEINVDRSMPLLDHTFTCPSSPAANRNNKILVLVFQKTFPLLTYVGSVAYLNLTFFKSTEISLYLLQI